MRVVNREVGAISFFCFFLDVTPRSATEWSGAGREAASPTAASTLPFFTSARPGSSS